MTTEIVKHEEGLRVKVEHLRKDDMVVATLGKSTLHGKVLMDPERSRMGAPFVHVNPTGDIHGWPVDDSWTIDLLERNGERVIS